MRRIVYGMMFVALLWAAGWNLQLGAAQGSRTLYLPVARHSTAINITLGAHAAPYPPQASADGEIVAFLSDSSTLVAGDTNELRDGFVWYRSTGTFRRVSVASDGSQVTGSTSGIWLSSDGRYVLFRNDSSILRSDIGSYPSLYRHDLLTGITELVAKDHYAYQANHTAAISADGNLIAFLSVDLTLGYPFPASCNGGDGGDSVCASLFIRDMTTGVTTALLVGSDGVLITPIRELFMSGDGQTVVYSRVELAGYVAIKTGWREWYDPFIYRLTRDGSEPTLVARSYATTPGEPLRYSTVNLQGFSSDASVVAYWERYDDPNLGRRTALRYRRGMEGDQILYSNIDWALVAEFTSSATGEIMVFGAGPQVGIPGSANEHVALFSYTSSTGTYQQLTLGEAPYQVEYPAISDDGSTLYYISDRSYWDLEQDYDLFVMPLD